MWLGTERAGVLPTELCCQPINSKLSYSILEVSCISLLCFMKVQGLCVYLFLLFECLVTSPLLVEKALHLCEISLFCYVGLFMNHSIGDRVFHQCQVFITESVWLNFGVCVNFHLAVLKKVILDLLNHIRSFKSNIICWDSWDCTEFTNQNGEETESASVNMNQLCSI